MVLVGLLLPVLRNARRGALNAASLASARQMVQALTLYGQDHKLSFPYFGTAGNPMVPLSINGVDVPTANGALYFRYQSHYWASAVLPYLSGRATLTDGRVLIDHGYRWGLAEDDLDKVVYCRYWLTTAAFAVPEFWMGTDTPTDLGLLRSTRFTHMKNPARKGLLIDVFSEVFAGDESVNSNWVLVAFGDGSTRKEHAFPVAPYVERPYQLEYFPTQATVGGLAGIDF